MRLGEAYVPVSRARVCEHTLVIFAFVEKRVKLYNQVRVYMGCLRKDHNIRRTSSLENVFDLPNALREILPPYLSRE